MPDDQPGFTAGWQVEDLPSSTGLPDGFRVIHTQGPDQSDEDAKASHRAALKINDFAEMIGEPIRKSTPQYEKAMKLRHRQMKAARRLAEDLQRQGGDADPIEALDALGRIKGEYEALSNALHSVEAAEFYNTAKPSDAEKEVTLGLRIKNPDSKATDEQVALSIEIQRAYDVVDIVMDRRRNRLEKVSEGAAQLTTWAAKQSLTVRNNYVRQLKEIADEGLISPLTTLYAARKLELFKDAFVQREADRVKNQHVKALGFWAALFAGILLLVAAATDLGFVQGIVTAITGAPLAPEVRNFLYLSVGACVGTWLSFSLRKVELGFDDLILLEPDRLNPTARIIFVILLTCVIGGIIDLGWLQISFASTQIALDTPGEALLLGTFCGIAERSLSGAVVGRANSISDTITPKKPTGDGS